MKPSKKILTAFLLLTGLASMQAQMTEERSVADFSNIRTAGAVRVEVMQSDKNSVSLVGEANDFKKTTTVVLDGTLLIEGEGGALVKVNIKQLNKIETTGGSSVKSTNQLQSPVLTIESSGGSKAKLQVNTPELNVQSSGASEVKLSGTAPQTNFAASGASSIRAYELQTDRAKVTSSGAANVRLTVSTSINAEASGSSSVRYQGNPTDVKADASGAGSITKRETESSSSDTTRLRIAGHDVTIAGDDDDDERSSREKKSNDESFETWAGLDFGVCGYLSGDNSVTLPQGFESMELNYGKSYVFGWNIWQKNIHVYRNNINIVTGIGLTWYHYNFKKSVTLLPNQTFATFSNDSFNYSKNRLNTCYVNVPLMLEFNTNNSDADRSFHIGAGMMVGYNVFNNKIKQKYELDGRKYKNTVKNSYNVNPFRFDAVARIGFGDYTIFGSYNLATLFENGKGPRVFPFTAGLHLDF
ncbi:MAG: head GIN domain-containing protein [Bacteroidia bacterium]